MGGSITLIVVLVGIAVGIATLLIYRQRSTARESAPNLVAAPKGDHAHKNHPPHKNEAEQWGVRIAASTKDQTCPQVRGLLGKEFPLEQKPSLPMKDCPFPQQCGCHYVKLFDRRKGERRSGKERRQAQRFEHGHHDRRSGKDRRKNKNLDWA